MSACFCINCVAIKDTTKERPPLAAERSSFVARRNARRGLQRAIL